MKYQNTKRSDCAHTIEPAEPTQAELDAFIQKAGFSYGWSELESWARRMAEHAVTEIKRKDAQIAMLSLINDAPIEDLTKTGYQSSSRRAPRN